MRSVDARALFQDTVIGDNATFIIGDNNRTSIKNTVKRGDFESLALALRSRGVEDSDIEKLRVAVEEDAELGTVEKGVFGPRVTDWMSSMWRKAVETSWNIEVGVASSALYDALKSFYFG